MVGLFRIKSNGGWQNLGTYNIDVLEKVDAHFESVPDKGGNPMGGVFFTDATRKQLAPYKIVWGK